MAIYLDHPEWWWRGRRWCHLISDVSLDELHAFAGRADLRYLSFGRDHYDVPEDLFIQCQAMGAELVDSRDIVRMLRRSGLREGRGKSFKSWRSTSAEKVAESIGPAPLAVAQSVADDLSASVDDASWLTRPGELVVLFEVPERLPGAADGLPTADELVGVERIVVTRWAGALVVEVVVPLDSDPVA